MSIVPEGSFQCYSLLFPPPMTNYPSRQHMLYRTLAWSLSGFQPIRPHCRAIVRAKQSNGEERDWSSQTSYCGVNPLGKREAKRHGADGVGSVVKWTSRICRVLLLLSSISPVFLSVSLHDPDFTHTGKIPWAVLNTIAQPSNKTSLTSDNRSTATMSVTTTLETPQTGKYEQPTGL